MQEQIMLERAISAPRMEDRHAAADALAHRLRVNGIDTDVLRGMDAILRKDVWKSISDKALRDKLQTIAIQVDMHMVHFSWKTMGKPRSMDSSIRMEKRDSGSWDMRSGRLRFG